MINCSNFLQLNKNVFKFLKENEIKKILNLNFTEKEILDFQNFFFGNEINFIEVDNIKIGREFIYKFSRSLNIKNKIACFTFSKIKLDKNILDLNFYLNSKEYIDNDLYFEVSFLWIEYFYNFKEKFYLNFLKKYLEILNINKIPILILGLKNYE